MHTCTIYMQTTAWQISYIFVHVDCTAINNQVNNIHSLPSGPCIQWGVHLHPPGYGPATLVILHSSNSTLTLFQIMQQRCQGYRVGWSPFKRGPTPWLTWQSLEGIAVWSTPQLLAKLHICKSASQLSVSTAVRFYHMVHSTVVCLLYYPLRCLP